MTRRWESQRPEVRTAAQRLITVAAVIVLPVTIWALAQITHGWALIGGTVLLLGAFLWATEDRS